MPEIDWIELTATTWYCDCGKYTLRKKRVLGKDIYEVWCGDEMEYNTSLYFDFMRKLSNYYKVNVKG